MSKIKPIIILIQIKINRKLIDHYQKCLPVYSIKITAICNLNNQNKNSPNKT